VTAGTGTGRDGRRDTQRLPDQVGQAGVRHGATPLRRRGISAIWFALGLGAAALFGLFLLPPLALTHRRDLPLEVRYGRAIVGLVSWLGGGRLRSPVARENRGVLETGRNAYTGSCAICHGASGDGRGVFGSATYPPATSLIDEDVRRRSDGQLFWVIKNGLSFTAMPSFADQYSDQDIWALVIYLRALQAGRAGPAVLVPLPAPEQLAVADPTGDAARRGAAVYFAAGCHLCHGPAGDAPGELALRAQQARELTEAVRRGRRGMPVYSLDQLSDDQLAALRAYVSTFSSGPRRG
jgi:mono/diheme cytochrome c family protein